MAGGVKDELKALAQFGGRSQGKSMLQDLINQSLSKGKKLSASYDVETVGRVAGMSPLMPKPSQEVLDKIRAQPIGWLDESSHMSDAFKYFADSTLAGTRGQHTTRVKTIADYSDAELVMEMIRRGYAAMKLPGDGGPPEVLRK